VTFLITTDLNPTKEISMSLKEQLAEYLAGWYQRVPPERQAIMQRHIEQLRSGAIARTMLKVGDRAPAIVLNNADGEAAGASLVAISPEKPDDTLSTTEKNALAFEVLSDVGQKVGRAFGLVYDFTEELKIAYRGFKLDIPAHNGTPDEWALPVSATYVIAPNGMIMYAYTDPDYRDRADPREVLKVLTKRAVAAA
jgi:peroxiredoxin